MSYENSIVLLGPMHVGKSTMAGKFYKKYSLPFIECDYLFDYYFSKSKKSRYYFDRLLEEKGFEECCKETDKFLYTFSKEILDMVKEIGTMSIIDFGGNHVSYKDEVLNDLIIRELKNFKNVIVLLPYKDKEKTFKYFRRLFSDPLRIKINEYIYECLTKDFSEFKTFYVNDQTEEELFIQIDEYVKRDIILEKPKIIEPEKKLEIKKITNKYFPNAFNIK